MVAATTSPCRATRSASAIICAAARSIACACSTSRSPRCVDAVERRLARRARRVSERPRRHWLRRCARAAARRARVRVRRAGARGSRSRRGDRSPSGMPIAACGEAIRIWAAGHLHKSREVTVVRAVSLGRRIRSTSGRRSWASASRSRRASVVGRGADRASIWSTTLTAAIKSEEAFLRRTFGDQYDRYRRGVARERASATRRAAVQPRAGDGEPRVPRGRRTGASRCCCCS